MRVLGLDPGSRTTGWGLIEGDSRSLQRACFGCLHGQRETSRARILAGLAAELDGILQRWQPDVAAIETPFTAKFPKAALALAETRGALLAVLGRWGGAVVEYEPARIKAAIVGYGRADKHQVAFMISRHLALDALPPSDAADALAVALCHLRSGLLPVSPAVKTL
ncbi:MAG TPA: crossover junction endodeoxyribonuclease RuvC [Thermoanaerobaculaceae bacterium]|nr:crossover junction endodeoxyribonuclease RuvC [Thermoanaerobaculaceae bacterium]HPS79544.1 crossover junction endodeoxyribonuclease RuvC [Thermoanaerobaculaceae bacterium]